MRAFGTFPVERGTGDTPPSALPQTCSTRARSSGSFRRGRALPHRDRPWHPRRRALALATGATVVPVCIVGSERALRPRKFKLGLPRIRVIVLEPVAVERERPTVASARALTAHVVGAIEEAREPYGPPAHAWYDEQVA